jgi:hypothetical protein
LRRCLVDFDHASPHPHPHQRVAMKRSLFLLLLAVPSSWAATILDYTASIPVIQCGGGSDSPVTMATSFTVGPYDVQITSVSVLLGGDASRTFDTTAYIFSNSVDHPGTPVGATHKVFQPPCGYHFHEYYFDTPLALSAGATYWRPPAHLGDWPSEIKAWFKRNLSACRVL